MVLCKWHMANTVNGKNMPVNSIYKEAVLVDDKTFELLEKMYVEFIGRFDKSDARFDKMDARFGQMDARFDQIDARFSQVDARFDQVEARLDRVESQTCLIRLTGMISKSR